MSEYTQGVCSDGAAILRDGQPMTVEEILEALRLGEREATGFRAMCEALERLETIVGLDTGGGMGPAPALNAVEHIIRQRDDLAARCEEAERLRDRYRAEARDLHWKAANAESARDNALAERDTAEEEVAGQAAYVARLRGLGQLVREAATDIAHIGTEELFDRAEKWDAALEGAPTASLARLKAETIQRCADKRRIEGGPGDQWVKGWQDAVDSLDGEVVRLRRQAEEPTQ